MQREGPLPSLHFLSTPSPAALTLVRRLQLTIAPIFALNNSAVPPLPRSGWYFEHSTVLSGNRAVGGAGGAIYVENLNITTIVCDT